MRRLVLGLTALALIGLAAGAALADDDFEGGEGGRVRAREEGGEEGGRRVREGGGEEGRRRAREEGGEEGGRRVREGAGEEGGETPRRQTEARSELAREIERAENRLQLLQRLAALDAVKADKDLNELVGDMVKEVQTRLTRMKRTQEQRLARMARGEGEGERRRGDDDDEEDEDEGDRWRGGGDDDDEEDDEGEGGRRERDRSREGGGAEGGLTDDEINWLLGKPDAGSTKSSESQ